MGETIKVFHFGIGIETVAISGNAAPHMDVPEPFLSLDQEDDKTLCQQVCMTMRYDTTIQTHTIPI